MACYYVGGCMNSGMKMTRTELEAKIDELEQALSQMEKAPLPLHVRNIGIRNYRRKIRALEEDIKALRN